MHTPLEKLTRDSEMVAPAATIKQALLYCCRKNKSREDSDVRICALLSDNTVVIAGLKGKLLIAQCFSDLPIEKMYKNTGGRSQGVICQLSPSSRKLIYMPNQFFRDGTLTGTIPYVSSGYTGRGCRWEKWRSFGR